MSGGWSGDAASYSSVAVYRLLEASTAELSPAVVGKNECICVLDLGKHLGECR